MIVKNTIVKYTALKVESRVLGRQLCGEFKQQLFYFGRV
jgi:hypothetical protein